MPPSYTLLGGFATGDGFRCYDNIAPNAKCQRVHVLALCLVVISFIGKVKTGMHGIMSI